MQSVLLTRVVLYWSARRSGDEEEAEDAYDRYADSEEERAMTEFIVPDDDASEDGGKSLAERCQCY